MEFLTQKVFTLNGTVALMLPLILTSISLDEMNHSWFTSVMSHSHSLVQIIHKTVLDSLKLFISMYLTLFVHN